MEIINSVSQQLSNSVTQMVSRQRDFFLTNETKSIDFRLKQLNKLKQAVEKYSDDIYDALWRDLHKCKEEAFLTEINIVLNEINNHIKNLKKWARPEKVKTPLYLMPSKSFVKYEPYGVALIIAPWNYPFQLMFAPLVGAISSGCCAVMKPSPYSQYTSEVMQKIIDETFDKEYITMIQGHRDVNQALLAQKFDFIFYTGSPDMGRVVMEAASKNLTPVVLELGGKSPCIVDSTAKIKLAAKRIVWGKFLNCGQTCVAPDYILCQESVKDQLLDELKKQITLQYGEKPLVLSEFGGKTYKTEGHIFNPEKSYGYGGCETLEDLNEALVKLYTEEILPCVKEGLTAAIYTQVSDVEDEINGMYTYDREVCKVNKEKMQKLADRIFAEINQ